MPYEFPDEVAIADVEIRAWGKDLSETFVSAADATMNIMVRDLQSIQPKEHREIMLHNEAADLLLFDFLQELIYYKDAEGLALRFPEVTIDKEGDVYRLTATAEGESLDPERHEFGVDVKAVTLHRFSLEQTKEGWIAYAILDI